ncbi:MAG: tetratricopeptide repeat protein, partial [Bacteroidia bacterium]
NSVSDKDTLHRAWHNIGNCYLQKKDFQQAIDAYKKSLKFNPKDEETRYNLAYALKHLPKDKKGGGGGQSNQPQNKDQKKEQSSKNEMTKDQADQLLKALMKDEKKLQDKRKQKQGDPANTSVDKDW